MCIATAVVLYDANYCFAKRLAESDDIIPEEMNTEFYDDDVVISVEETNNSNIKVSILNTKTLTHIIRFIYSGKYFIWIEE